MNKKTVTLLALFFLSQISLSEASFVKSGSPLHEQVRVAIVRDSREVDLAIHGSYRIRDMSTGKIIGKGSYLTGSKVRLLDRGILMGLDVYRSRRLTVEPSRDASIIIDGRPFRGEVTFIRTEDNRITVINDINIEDYVKGVLYHEVSHYWPMEALKAQAVATRTYALYSIGPSGKPYDVTNDIYSQVYGGKSSERYRTDLAVNYTKGQVLTYNGQIIPAYFHATCAGMTEDARELWNVKDLPSLRGVPCAFCQNSPHMHWKKNFRLHDIQEALNLHGYKVGVIKEISIVDRDRSGRIDHLRITPKNGGEPLTIRGKDFRDLMGPNVIMSNNYEIIMRGYYVDLVGKGWGHGVGMCQWGALGMAKQQFNYKQILSYYYPQSALANYHGLQRTEIIKASKPSNP